MANNTQSSVNTNILNNIINQDVTKVLNYSQAGLNNVGNVSLSNFSGVQNNITNTVNSLVNANFVGNDIIPEIQGNAVTFGELYDAGTKVVSNIAEGVTTAITDPQKILDFAEYGITNLGKEIIGGIEGQANKMFGQIGAMTNRLSNIVQLGNIVGSINSIKSIVNLGQTPPFQNVLHSYSSYNYIFTLSIIDDKSYNFPNETYKRGDLGKIIFKSGSGDPTNRIQTDYGKFDFYVDDINISSLIGFDKATGNTNATSIKFKIYETYSMGLFFESVQNAAKECGYDNYITAPFLLTLEFMGHISDSIQGVPGDSLSPIEKTTKHFPIKLMNLDMKVTAAGAEYDVQAIPYNEQAHSNSYREMKTDASITGATIHEVLQTGENSLQRIMNDRLKEAAKAEKNRIPDEILILFPTDIKSGNSVQKESGDAQNTATVDPNNMKSSSSTIEEKLKVSTQEREGYSVKIQDLNDINPIGKASLKFDAYRAGKVPFSKDEKVYDEKTGIYKRGHIELNLNKATLNFQQGEDIVHIINEVILASDYPRQAMSKENQTESGKFPWGRIETQLFVNSTDANAEITGVKPKIVVYRVIPYLVDTSDHLPPQAANPKIEQAKKQAIKEYNYIYTSKNIDVLDFDIEFKAAFYQAINADSGTKGGDINRSSQTSSISPETSKVITYNTPSEAIHGDVAMKKQNEQPVQQRATNTGTSTYGRGGAGVETHETAVARQAHEVILNGIDMIKPNMKILGDPYYIGDSGMGNYTAESTEYENINADHSIDYQGGEVDIIVNFRTPIDVDPLNNSYKFAPTKILNQFSGLYKVCQVESNFSKGYFTQNLTMFRRIGQNQQ